MAAAPAMRPLAICSRCLKSPPAIALPIRSSFSTAPSLLEPAAAASSAAASNPPPLVPTAQLDPNTVSTVSEEQRLWKHRKISPIGSRRRRAVLASMKDAIPFEQLPYQCFQEARSLLAQDREEKVQQIAKMRKRIANVEALDAAAAGGEPHRQHRLSSMRRELERLKILADINDPMVKKRFEDGLGDMNKPIYRYLADKKWRAMKRKVLVQRITQMHVVPDVLPELEPSLDVDLVFHRRIITPGEFVPSNWSENAPSLRIQKFDKGESVYTIVAVDSDVPNVDTDGFDSRCHGIWTGIRVDPTKADVGRLGRDSEAASTVVPWSPPYALKGSPYHRISLVVFEQPAGTALSSEQIADIKQNMAESGLWLRGFAEKTGFKAVGVTMFRTQWDESMAMVMERHGIPGAEMEFRRRKPEKLPPKYRVKDGLRYRGWRK